MSPKPYQQYDYVFLKGEGNKGVSYKYTWKPEIKIPPGVRPLRVLLNVSLIMGVAAIPVFIWPYFRGPKPETEPKAKPNIYAVIKERNREERLKWIQSEDMPPR